MPKSNASITTWEEKNKLYSICIIATNFMEVILLASKVVGADLPDIIKEVVLPGIIIQNKNADEKTISKPA